VPLTTYAAAMTEQSPTAGDASIRDSTFIPVVPGGKSPLAGAVVDPDLSLAADYGEVGADPARFGSYAVVPIRKRQATVLDRNIRDAMLQHAPRAFATSPHIELHMKDLWSSQRRAKSPLADLAPLKDFRKFLLTLSKSIGKRIPFCVAVVTEIPQVASFGKTERSMLVNGLLTMTYQTMTGLLAQEGGVMVGDTSLHIDRGDSFKTLSQRMHTYDWDLKTVDTSQTLTNDHVDSAGHRAV